MRSFGFLPVLVLGIGCHNPCCWPLSCCEGLCCHPPAMPAECEAGHPREVREVAPPARCEAPPPCRPPQAAPCPKVEVKPAPEVQVTVPPQKVVVTSPAPAPGYPTGAAPITAPMAVMAMPTAPARASPALGIHWIRIPFPVPRLYAVPTPEEVTIPVTSTQLVPMTQAAPVVAQAATPVQYVPQAVVPQPVQQVPVAAAPPVVQAPAPQMYMPVAPVVPVAPQAPAPPCAPPPSSAPGDCASVNWRSASQSAAPAGQGASLDTLEKKVKELEQALRERYGTTPGK